MDTVISFLLLGAVSLYFICIKTFGGAFNERPVQIYSIIIFIAAVFIMSIIYNSTFRKGILEKGVAGKGILVSCKTPFMIAGKFNIFFHCFPVVGFYLGEKYYEKGLYGNYHTKPCEIGEEIEIIMYEEKEIHIVPQNFDFKKDTQSDYLYIALLIGLMLYSLIKIIIA